MWKKLCEVALKYTKVRTIIQIPINRIENEKSIVILELSSWIVRPTTVCSDYTFASL